MEFIQSSWPEISCNPCSPRAEYSLADFQLPKVSAVVEDPRPSYARRAFAPVGVEMRRFVIVA